MNLSSLRNYRVTIVVCVVAVIVYAFPPLAGILQLDLNAVDSGQWWRIWTGHLTHYDGSHLFWDLLMFAVLAGVCERIYPRMFAPAIAIMAAGISAVIALACPEITVYRGLSGIDTGLFVWFATTEMRRCRADRDSFSMLLWMVPCAGLIGKLVFEAMTGQTLFVDSSGFTPLVESHLAGAAIGLMIACLSRREASSDSGQDPRMRDVQWARESGLSITRLLPIDSCGGEDHWQP